MAFDTIFQPLTFKNLTVKNRLFRSNISGRFDNYDGSGNQARINWETKFAQGGVGAIISSFVPVHLRGRIVPNYAMIDHDNKIPFWRAVGKAVHEHDCKFIMQLSHGGRQRDINGVEYPKGLSSTGKKDPLHGFECEAMTIAQIKEVVGYFAEGARRAREAGLDGVELHGANGYLITQFLSSAINDRTDEYGGSLENRARFVLDVVKAVRAKVGNDFHFQMKISAVEFADALSPLHIGSSGNTLEDSVQVCKWLVDAGIDAIHVSTGAFFPHPKNPCGSDLPVEDLVKSYDTMISSGERTFANFLLFHGASGVLARQQWNKEAGPANEIEGKNLPDAHVIKAAVNVPVICTGGFQTASVIEKAIQNKDCDAVSMARTLVANNNLPKVFASGKDRAEKPCSYCNKCLVNVVENPLGCYDVSRFNNDREAMVAQIMSVFSPPPFVEQPATV
jgi:2,4-dienoyl-CoA reductase (NADPH2)